MFKYKYVHLIWPNELKFSKPLIDLFENNEEELKSEEHCFITPNKDVYEIFKGHKNVILDDGDENLFNKYAPLCDFVISHDFPSKKIVLSIKNKYKKKIVYRFWGGRRPLIEKQKYRFFHNIYAYLYNFMYKLAFRYIYDNLALIGIANVVDEIDLKDYIRKTPLMRMPYPNNGAYHSVQEIKKTTKKNNPELNVVIGHRSEPLEKHIKYLELLKKFPEDKFRIYLPLSYGDKDYAKKVVDYVNENKLNNVVLMTEFMEYKEYLKFVSQMDIAIIDCENSLALGNINLYLTFNKTIYISPSGVIKKAFDYKSVPHHCVNELDEMDFGEFSSLLSVEDCPKEFTVNPYSYYVELWKDILNYLQSIKR
ncbi:hypothetical protein B5F13_01090 [Drancourtella sp. An177]|nr:hypothetical protein B5F13_01090 [Drancourtella sp. An177]